MPVSLANKLWKNVMCFLLITKLKGSGQCCVHFALRHQVSARSEEMECLRVLSCMTSEWLGQIFITTDDLEDLTVGPCESSRKIINASGSVFHLIPMKTVQLQLCTGKGRAILSDCIYLKIKSTEMTSHLFMSSKQT